MLPGAGLAVEGVKEVVEVPEEIHLHLVLTVGAPDLLHQLPCIAKTILRGKYHSFGDISPKCKYIFNSKLPEICDNAPDLLLGGRRAGQVSQAQYAQIVLDMGRDPRRILAGSSARPVGHADVGRLKRRNLVRGVQYLVKSRIRLGRKHLKGNVYLIFVQPINDLHIILPVNLCRAPHTVSWNCSMRSPVP